MPYMIDSDNMVIFNEAYSVNNLLDWFCDLKLAYDLVLFKGDY